MEMSEHINELSAALAKAQGQMEGAIRDAANPFYKSKYADLQSVWTACRKPLSENGLSILQSPSADGVRVSLETLLTHASGQWVRGTVTVSAKDDSPQAVGSCISYLRRYALQSFVGVAPEDDDAEAAQGRPFQKTTTAPVVAMPPPGFSDWLIDLESTAPEGTPALEKAWKASKPEYRQYMTTYQAVRWAAMKETANLAGLVSR